METPDNEFNFGIKPFPIEWSQRLTGYSNPAVVRAIFGNETIPLPEPVELPKFKPNLWTLTEIKESEVTLTHVTEEGYCKRLTIDLSRNEEKLRAFIEAGIGSLVELHLSLDTSSLKADGNC